MRKPNYRFERAERDRAKQAKKEEKLKRQQERVAESAQAEGIAIAREMVRHVRSMVAGVHLSATFGKYRMAIDVVEAIS